MVWLGHECTRRTPPAELLLREASVAPRHLRHVVAGLEALHYDARLVVPLPLPPPTCPGDEFDAAQRHDGVIGTVVRTVLLRLEHMLKRIVKSIAHTRASSHGRVEAWSKCATRAPLLRRYYVEISIT